MSSAQDTAGHRGAPYLLKVYLVHDRVPSFEAFPFSLPFVRKLK
jgi:predicted ATPase